MSQPSTPRLPLHLPLSVSTFSLETFLPFLCSSRNTHRDGHAVVRALDAVLDTESDRLVARSLGSASSALLLAERESAMPVAARRASVRLKDDGVEKALDRGRDEIYHSREWVARSERVLDAFESGRLSGSRIAASAHRRAFASSAPPDWNPSKPVAPHAPPFPRVGPGERAAARILTIPALQPATFDPTTWFKSTAIAKSEEEAVGAAASASSSSSSSSSSAAAVTSSSSSSASTTSIPSASSSSSGMTLGRVRRREEMEEGGGGGGGGGGEEEGRGGVEEDVGTLFALLPKSVRSSVRKEMKKQAKARGWVAGQPLELSEGWDEELCTQHPQSLGPLRKLLYLIQGGEIHVVEGKEPAAKRSKQG